MKFIKEVFIMFVMSIKLLFGIPEKYVIRNRQTGEEVVFDVVNRVLYMPNYEITVTPEHSDILEETYELVRRA